MAELEFKSFVVKEVDGKFTREVKLTSLRDLPPGDLLVKVHYSSLNYKDALSSTGNRGVTRKYPHTPGIDAVGTVVASESGRFKADDQVIVTSYDLGMNTSGGFGQYIRVPSEWALLLPDHLTMKEAMILGTAGLTAGMAVMRLSETIKPGDGTIIVSGATGGVGAMSISILKKLGYNISAITGKANERDYLSGLGADNIILRNDFETIENKPLQKPTIAGAIDTVGGVILENIIKSTHLMGVVICCGNVASPKIDLTVYPFILRGVSLIGIDTQNVPMRTREIVWQKLSGEWKPDHLNDSCNEITLYELSEKIDLMLQGRLKGRTVINLQNEKIEH